MLVQGIIVTQDNVDAVLDDVERKLIDVENAVASEFAVAMEQHVTPDSDRLTGGLFDDDLTEIPETESQQMNPEASLVSAIRAGLHALDLLPENSAASGWRINNSQCLHLSICNGFNKVWCWSLTEFWVFPKRSRLKLS